MGASVEPGVVVVVGARVVDVPGGTRVVVVVGAGVVVVVHVPDVKVIVYVFPGADSLGAVQVPDGGHDWFPAGAYNLGRIKSIPPNVAVITQRAAPVRIVEESYHKYPWFTPVPVHW